MSGAGDVLFKPASDQSLLISLEEKITLEAHQRSLKLLRLLESRPIEGVRNLHPAYCSLLVQFEMLEHQKRGDVG